jgi:outer membrane beta-barrel protein
MVLLPHAAYAQKKKPTKSGNSGTAAPTSADAPPPAPANADADADQPAAPPAGQPAPGAPPAGGETPAPSGGGDTGGLADICQITPDAPQCQAAKEINLSTEAKKAVRAEVYAVQQQYVIKAQRLEIMPYYAVTLNDQFVSHNAPGLALNYYITQVLAVGVNGNWYQGLNQDSGFNFQNREAANVAVPLNDYQFSADLNFTYVPMYGKFAGFGDFIFHYDTYVLGGLGIIRTRPESIIDPDNRKFTDWYNAVNFDVGIGVRIFFTRWLAAVLEVRDLIFFDKIENVTVATGSTTSAPGTQAYANNPQNPATWYQNNQFTNDVQLQVGLSFFLPTSFEYRLPK